MKKSSGHTGFRNGKLFCFNCGESYDLHYPQPVDMATAMMKQFSKTHSHCSPVWKEPVNDQPETKNEIQNAMWKPRSTFGRELTTTLANLFNRQYGFTSQQ